MFGRGEGEGGVGVEGGEAAVDGGGGAGDSEQLGEDEVVAVGGEVGFGVEMSKGGGMRDGCMIALAFWSEPLGA